MSFIPNATPQIVLLGTDDRSAAAPVPAATARPTHLPLVHFFARRAFPGVNYVGAGAQSIYHTDTFDPSKKYFNGGTALARGFLNEGNAIMAENIIPSDAKIAKVRLWIEVLDSVRPIYERNSDGSIKYEAGAPVATADTTPGVRVRFVTTPIPDDGTPGAFGVGTVTAGTWTEDTATSELIPLIDMHESAFGEDGNFTAARFFPLRSGSQDLAVDESMLLRDRIYPFGFSIGRKADQHSSVKAARTLTGVLTSLFSFKPGARISRTNEKIGFIENVVNKYNRSGHQTLPDVKGFMANAAVYQSNIDALLERLTGLEKAYIATNPALATNYDFVDDGEDEKYLFNLFGGTSFRGYPYHSYTIEASAAGYMPTSAQWAMFEGGSDGTMNAQTYASGVKAAINEYADSFSPRQDDARRIESIYYDPGLALEDKYELLNILAIRKDIALALGVYEYGAPSGTAASNYSTAAALRARAALFPESVHFGTGVSRVLIMGYSGTLVMDDDQKRYSCLYEVAMKSAAFMGAGNRRWRDEKRPTGYPGSIVTHMANIDVDYSPLDQRIQNWDIGLNWIQNFDVTQKHIPAFRSVYQDDTSILTGWFHNLAIVEINKVCQQVHRIFSGRDDLTNLQLARRVDEKIAEELRGVFGTRYRIDVTTSYTDEDIRRNYSWSTRVRLGAAGSKTVMTAHVEAYRIEDFPADGSVTV